MEVRSLFDYPEVPPVEEDGRTFMENAVKKARYTCAATGEAALADDSGLEVDCLGGAPGVHSARFAGLPGDDEANNHRLLQLLAGVPLDRRTARFRCAVAVAFPDGELLTAEGTCEGLIVDEPRGKEGFGYDPLFYLPEYGKTVAELDLETKNRVSHRGRAMAAVCELLARKLGRRD
jgi:XTP/dITP diphosphohydrolase